MPVKVHTASSAVKYYHCLLTRVILSTHYINLPYLESEMVGILRGCECHVYINVVNMFNVYYTYIMLSRLQDSNLVYV